MPGTSVCSPLWYLWHYDLLVFQEEGREGKREGGKREDGYLQNLHP